ncbi:MAG: hypothetical protein COB12_09880 [Flavobacterium sp.]|nr:MAG: hypothetical protein COB12_09880 [Flavobacterium sp.]
MTEFCSFFPLAVDKTLGESKLDDFVKSCQEQQVTDIERLINKNNHTSLLSAIFSNSPYLSRLLFRDVKFAEMLLSMPFDDLYQKVVKGMTEDIPHLKDISQLMRALRKAKAQVALIISFADLSGSWSLAVITRCLTEFAEISVSLTPGKVPRVSSN